MGQIFAKPHKSENIKTPHDILGTNELSKLSEIKKAYKKLFYENQRDLEAMEKINWALKEVESNFDINLYLEIYTKVFLPSNELDTENNENIKKGKSKEIKNNKKPIAPAVTALVTVSKNSDSSIKIKYKETQISFNFLETTVDVFDKIALAYEIKHPPKLTDPDFIKFYTFWSRFLSNDKDLEVKVRKMVRIVKSNDPRIVKINKVENREEKRIESRGINKDIKMWKIQCVGCNKGFNSANTLKDHLNSKQHKESGLETIIYNVPREQLENIKKNKQAALNRH